MQCPVCSVDLVMSERQGIEIDYCPKCRGVWLDRGELDKIIERSATLSASMRPEAPRQAPEQYHGHKDNRPYPQGHKRHKSFLEELFD
ncbi:MAG: zf-TFIIB domain-containing protein [Pseudomonadota bacterium]